MPSDTKRLSVGVPFRDRIVKERIIGSRYSTVVALTDTWSSTDGNPHSLDLLYDDYVGMFGNGDGLRGFEFPGQSNFAQYNGDDAVAGLVPRRDHVSLLG